MIHWKSPNLSLILSTLVFVLVASSSAAFGQGTAVTLLDNFPIGSTGLLEPKSINSTNGVTLRLRNPQKKLMNDPATSHPCYWSGFAIIGDGARPFPPAYQNVRQDKIASKATGAPR